MIRTLSLLCAATLFLACEKKEPAPAETAPLEDPVAPAPVPAPQATTATLIDLDTLPVEEEFEAEAEQEISADNLVAKLDELEKEIAAE